MIMGEGEPGGTAAAGGWWEAEADTLMESSSNWSSSRSMMLSMVDTCSVKLLNC